MPDVSLFAGNGAWLHLYLFCLFDPTYDLTCTAPPDYWLAGGALRSQLPSGLGFRRL